MSDANHEGQECTCEIYRAVQGLLKLGLVQRKWDETANEYVYRATPGVSAEVAERIIRGEEPIDGIQWGDRWVVH